MKVGPTNTHSLYQTSLSTLQDKPVYGKGFGSMMRDETT